jgi:hypothetical protein
MSLGKQDKILSKEQIDAVLSYLLAPVIPNATM